MLGIVLGNPRPQGIVWRISSLSCVIIGTLAAGTPFVGVISSKSGVTGCTIGEFCASISLLFSTCFLDGRGVLYHFSVSNSGRIVISVSSGISGIGILLRVLRWWIFFAAFTILEAVVSFDVDGPSTL